MTDQLMDDLSNEEHEALLLMSEHAIAPPLSAAAQAVLYATAVEACLAEWGPVNNPPCHPDDEGWNGCHLCVKRGLIAAAIRATADQVVPSEKEGGKMFAWQHERLGQRRITRDHFLAIAAELEGVND